MPAGDTAALHLVTDDMSVGFQRKRSCTELNSSAVLISPFFSEIVANGGAERMKAI